MKIPNELTQAVKELQKFSKAGKFKILFVRKNYFELIMDLYGGGDVSYGTGNKSNMLSFISGMIIACDRIKNKDLAI